MLSLRKQKSVFCQTMLFVREKIWATSKFPAIGIKKVKALKSQFLIQIKAISMGKDEENQMID